MVVESSKLLQKVHWSDYNNMEVIIPVCLSHMCSTARKGLHPTSLRLSPHSTQSELAHFPSPHASLPLSFMSALGSINTRRGKKGRGNMGGRERERKAESNFLPTLFLHFPSDVRASFLAHHSQDPFRLYYSSIYRPSLVHPPSPPFLLTPSLFHLPFFKGPSPPVFSSVSILSSVFASPSFSPALKKPPLKRRRGSSMKWPREMINITLSSEMRRGAEGPSSSPNGFRGSTSQQHHSQCAVHSRVSYKIRFNMSVLFPAFLSRKSFFITTYLRLRYRTNLECILGDYFLNFFFANARGDEMEGERCLRRSMFAPSLILKSSLILSSSAPRFQISSRR